MSDKQTEIDMIAHFTDIATNALDLAAMGVLAAAVVYGVYYAVRWAKYEI